MCRNRKPQFWDTNDLIESIKAVIANVEDDDITSNGKDENSTEFASNNNNACRKVCKLCTVPLTHLVSCALHRYSEFSCLYPALFIFHEVARSWESLYSIQ
jgi:hypothetical protein